MRDAGAGSGLWCRADETKLGMHVTETPEPMQTTHTHTHTHTVNSSVLPSVDGTDSDIYVAHLGPNVVAGPTVSTQTGVSCPLRCRVVVAQDDVYI